MNGWKICFPFGIRAIFLGELLVSGSVKVEQTSLIVGGWCWWWWCWWWCWWWWWWWWWCWWWWCWWWCWWWWWCCCWWWWWWWWWCVYIRLMPNPGMQSWTPGWHDIIRPTGMHYLSLNLHFPLTSWERNQAWLIMVVQTFQPEKIRWTS